MADGYNTKASKQEIDVAWWMLQVRAGIEFRKKFAREASWKRWRKFYRGEWSPRTLPKNLFFQMIRTMVPRVYFRNPSVSITSLKPGTEYQILSKILERADNSLIDRMGVKHSMKRIVQDGFLFGTGVGKLGYGAEFTPTPEMLGTEGPNTGRGRVEYNSFVYKDTPWFMRVPTGSFIVPAGLVSFESARWVAHWIRRPVSDVQDDPRFKNVADITPSKIKTPGGSMIEEFTKEPQVDLVEIRDKKTQMVFIICPHGSEGKKVVFQDLDDLQIKGRVPYYPVIFNTDDESFWGVPDSQILEPQQREANETRTLIMKHRRASLKKWAVKGDSLQPGEEAKLVDDDNVMATIKIDEIGNIKSLDPGGIPEGLIQSDEMIEREVEKILGLGVNQTGEYAPGSSDRSATEAQIVNQATQIRVDERRDELADVLVDIVEDMHQVLFERWGGEQVIDVIGPYGVQIWVKFTNEMLKSGSYAVHIDPDTSLPETKQLREQRAIQLYGVLKPNPLIDPTGLTEYLLHELHGTEFDNLLMKQTLGSGPQNPVSVGQLAQAVPQLNKMGQQQMGQMNQRQQGQAAASRAGQQGAARQQTQPRLVKG